MSITIANNALGNCTKIEDVVELINDEFSSDATASQIAAAYAIESAVYNEEDELYAQLEAIDNAGAKFQFAEALELAVKHA
jgi:hypothetical protein